MKTNKIITLFFLIINLTIIAQPRFKEKKEQIKALKIAYVTEELSLTPEEATKFWPLFNAFEEKQRELRQEKLRSYMKRLEAGELDKMTDANATVFLNQIEIIEEELFQLRKKFVISLKGVISAKKIIKLKRAEDNFNKKLLKQYREKSTKE